MSVSANVVIIMTIKNAPAMINVQSRPIIYIVPLDVLEIYQLEK